MNKRAFGNTGLMVSPLGLGTVKLGRDSGVKYPNGFSIPDDQSARSLLDLAWDLGINLLDTAPAYGISEQRLGQLLKNDTRDWLVCSKVGEEFENGESHFDFSPEHTRYSIERSLKRLGRETIDIVLVHSDGNDVDIIKRMGTLDALAALKQQGLIRSIGFSGKTVEGGLLAAEKSDAVMLSHHPAYTDERPVLDYCARHNKGALIKKAFASGHMSGDEFSESLRFSLEHPGTSSIIIGTINPLHLQQNVDAVNALG